MRSSGSFLLGGNDQLKLRSFQVVPECCSCGSLIRGIEMGKNHGRSSDVGLVKEGSPQDVPLHQCRTKPQNSWTPKMNRTHLCSRFSGLERW